MSEIMDQPDPGLDLTDGFRPHTSHWGVFSARMREGLLDVRPYGGDPDPNGIIDNFPGALRHRARIAQPMIRRGWLERGPGPVRAAGATSSSRCRGTRRWTCSAAN
jgi:biotin/methionine sulfoxide reductase